MHDYSPQLPYSHLQHNTFVGDLLALIILPQLLSSEHQLLLQSVSAICQVSPQACNITIDTGSNISIVRTDLLTEEDQIWVQPVSSCLRAVTDERALIHGKGELQLRIGP